MIYVFGKEHKIWVSWTLAQALQTMNRARARWKGRINKICVGREMDCLLNPEGHEGLSSRSWRGLSWEYCGNEDPQGRLGLVKRKEDYRNLEWGEDWSALPFQDKLHHLWWPPTITNSMAVTLPWSITQTRMDHQLDNDYFPIIRINHSVQIHDKVSEIQDSKLC